MQKKIKHPKLKKFVLFVGLTSPWIAFDAYGSGFQLFEQSGAAVGDFGAGAAANAEDASINFYNAAGLPFIQKQQLVLSLVGVKMNAHFNGTVNWSDTLFPSDPPFPISGTADGGITKAIPAIHYAAPFNERVVFGISVAPPFGLETDYGENSVVRYAATKTALTTIDISPSLGVKMAKWFYVGAGVDVVYGDATFNSVAGVPLVTPIKAFDTISTNEGDDWAVGWHAGVLLAAFDNKTRLGVSYRSKVDFHLSGHSTFRGPLAMTSINAISSHHLMADLTMPATTYLSLYQKINDTFAVMGSAIYTEWDVIDVIQLKNVAGLDSDGNTTATLGVRAPQHFDNTWRFVLGLHAKINDKWKLRTGVGFDETPTQAHYRDLRLPDEDRVSVSVGLHFQPTAQLGLDVGYTHIFIKEAKLNYTDVVGSESVAVQGIVDDSADLVGGQLVWNFS